MRRVSSRQRLVSWDAFDASRDSSDVSESDYSDNDHPLESSVVILAKMHATATTAGSQSFTDGASETSSTRSSNLNSTIHSTLSSSAVTAASQSQRRKRGRRKHHGPVVVPSFAWEVEAPPSSHLLRLEQLVPDVQWHILSFLDVASLRSVLQLNHKYRDLVQSDEAAVTVWQPHVQRKWPMMDSSRMGLVDAYALPTAAAASSKSEFDVNLPLLLSMTPSALPSEVDISLLDHPRRRSHTRNSALRSHRRITHQLMRAPMPTKLQVYKPHSEHQQQMHQSIMIRYTGPVGSGDRCIRANHPMPRPIRKTSTWGRPKFLMRGNSSHSMNSGGLIGGSTNIPSNMHGSLFDLICQGARAVSRRGMADWRPFVCPYLQKDGTLDVTPRMVAYYEVEILEKPQDSNTSDTDGDDDDSFPPPPRRANSTSECVAVGIATESFHVHSRMPGWDSLSFGYHGDDGGIFHSSGGMVERFGPTFGTGDTVGCGIDYVQQGIFFTLNGKFLGYGWKNIGTEFLHNDLYPVVGIDTNAVIALNFGTNKPFKYDLSEFHSKHAQLIEPQYQFSKRAGSIPRGLGAIGRSTSSGSLSSRFSRRSASKR